MGCRLSTTPDSSSTLTSIKSAPNLPLDVLVEIISHLSPGRDGQTLLSVALCCSALRNPSQRMLFDTGMGYGKNMIIDAHIKFLQTIVDSPGRLALFVRSYTQIELALVPSSLSSMYRAPLLSLSYGRLNPLNHLVEAQTLENIGHRVKIWGLTAKALPLMRNLKNLYFKPAWDHPSATSLLRDCTFQLEAFTWMGTGNEEWLFERFLTDQRGLLHVKLNPTSFDDRSILPNDLFPNLISVACTFSAFAKIAGNRPITAFLMLIGSNDSVHVEKTSAAERQQYYMGLKRLKYLRVESLFEIHRLTSGTSFNNTVVLELMLWGICVRL